MRELGPLTRHRPPFGLPYGRSCSGVRPIGNEPRAAADSGPVVGVGIGEAVASLAPADLFTGGPESFIWIASIASFIFFTAGSHPCGLPEKENGVARNRP